MGGVQEYYKIKPDMAGFSKGMANGMPLSIYVGKREGMSICDEGGKMKGIRTMLLSEPFKMFSENLKVSPYKLKENFLYENR